MFQVVNTCTHDVTALQKMQLMLPTVRALNQRIYVCRFPCFEMRQDHKHAASALKAAVKEGWINRMTSCQFFRKMADCMSKVLCACRQAAHACTSMWKLTLMSQRALLFLLFSLRQCLPRSLVVHEIFKLSDLWQQHSICPYTNTRRCCNGCAAQKDHNRRQQLQQNSKRKHIQP